MAVPRVLIAEDHQVVAEGLVRLLGDSFEVVDVVSDGRRAVEAAARLEPDISLLDVSMPHVSGLDAIRQLIARRVRTRIVVLTMHADPSLAVDVIKAGAVGFILKESSAEDLLTALDVVLKGGTYLAPALTKDVLRLMINGSDAAWTPLTIEQREVLRMLAQGQRIKEIAAVLDLSPRTVQAIKQHMMQLLDVHSTAELVRYAIEQRLTLDHGAGRRGSVDAH
jgi:DNA-binding NarL/FixJ family response regulator